jgi:hypothetical protein
MTEEINARYSFEAYEESRRCENQLCGTLIDLIIKAFSMAINKTGTS